MNMNYDEKPKGSKYPTQCWVAQNTTQTLSLENELEPPGADSEFSPYTMHGLYSRLKLVLVLPAKAGVLYYNIRHTDEIAYFLEQYEEAKIQRRMQKNNTTPKRESQASNAPANTNTNSPAYTVVFRAGNKKGKTAAQYLLETNDVEGLQESAEFFEANLERFPEQNAKYIEAIDDAIYLYETGKLQNSATPDSAKANHSCYVVLDQHNKYIGSVKRDLKVTCYFDADYPWEFEFKSHKLDEKKSIMPGSTVTGVYSLNDEQMAGLIYAMRQIMNAYVVNMYPAMDILSKTMNAQNHNSTSYDAVEDMVGSLLKRLHPALVKNIKEIINVKK